MSLESTSRGARPRRPARGGVPLAPRHVSHRHARRGRRTSRRRRRRCAVPGGIPRRGGVGHRRRAPGSKTRAQRRGRRRRSTRRGDGDRDRDGDCARGGVVPRDLDGGSVRGVGRERVLVGEETHVGGGARASVRGRRTSPVAQRRGRRRPRQNCRSRRGRGRRWRPRRS